MQSLLLDTDVFSFLFKRDTRAALYEPHLQGARPCLSFQSLAELRYWARIKRWGAPRRRSLATAIARYVLLPYDNAVCDQWAEVTAHRRDIGQPIECGDAWIAATALRHRIPLLTHNSRHYEHIPGLVVISHA